MVLAMRAADERDLLLQGPGLRGQAPGKQPKIEWYPREVSTAITRGLLFTLLELIIPWMVA